jgi:hypothetical protein
MARNIFLFILLCTLLSDPAAADVSDEQVLKAVQDFHSKISRKIDDWNCSWNDRDLEGTPVAKLKGPDGFRIFVVPVLCFAHQSNATTVFYGITRNEDKLDVSPMSCPVSVDGKAFSATVPLANGAFSGENDEVIESYMSGYGYLRDFCGSDLRYSWTGYEFVLTTIKSQPCCEEKGAGKWCDPDSDIEPPKEKPVIFSHKVEPWK